MMEAAALALAWGGFTALSLAMRRHRHLWRRASSRSVRNILRAGGSLALVAALGICIGPSGWSIGLVLWTGILTAAALLVVVQIAGAHVLSRRT